MPMPFSASEQGPETENEEETNPPENDGGVDPLVQAGQEVCSSLEADLLIYSGDIDKRGVDDLITRAKKFPTRSKNCLLILTTMGGDPDSAYRLGRYLQKEYENFILLVTGKCKSAGTIIALGAHEIILTDFGELGPLDIQLGKTDELWEMISGLNITQALDSLSARSLRTFSRYLAEIRVGSQGNVSTKLAAEIATNLTTGLFGKIYEQVDPSRLGEIERALNIAFDYGDRLKTDNVKEDTLPELVTGYPSHSFVIDRSEAQELFENAREPTPQEEELIELLGPNVKSPHKNEPLTFFFGNPDTFGTPDNQGATQEEPKHGGDEQRRPPEEPGGEKPEGDASDRSSDGEQRGEDGEDSQAGGALLS